MQSFKYSEIVVQSQSLWHIFNKKHKKTRIAIIEFNNEYCYKVGIDIKCALLELHKKNNPHLHQSLSFNELDRSNLATQELVFLCDALFEMHQALVSIKDSPDDNAEQQLELFQKLFSKFLDISSAIVFSQNSSFS